MERSGTAEMRLSTYAGRSSLFQSANWERFDTAYPDDPHARKKPTRGGVKDQEVKILLLKRHHTIQAICRQAGVSNTVVLRVRKSLVAQGLLPRRWNLW